MSKEIDQPLWKMFPKYASYFINGGYTSFLSQANINTIRKYPEYFIIDEKRSDTRKLYAKLSTKGELFMEFSKL